MNNNELRIFENAEFGQIRTITIDNETWFVGKDIANILEYKNTRDAIRKHVDEEDKGVANETKPMQILCFIVGTQWQTPSTLQR